MADMTATFASAAKGNVEAQRAMLDHMVITALQPGAVCPEFLALIEMWARMVAMHGCDDDRRRLSGVLIFKGSMARLAGRRDLADPLVSEGSKYLRELIDTGDNRAAAQLVELSRRLANEQAVPAEIMLGDAAPTSH